MTPLIVDYHFPFPFRLHLYVFKHVLYCYALAVCFVFLQPLFDCGRRAGGSFSGVVGYRLTWDDTYSLLRLFLYSFIHHQIWDCSAVSYKLVCTRMNCLLLLELFMM